MTKTVPVPDHDPLRTGTPRRESKVWGKRDQPQKAWVVQGATIETGIEPTRSSTCATPSGNVGEVLPAAEIMNRLAGEALEALAATCRR